MTKSQYTSIRQITKERKADKYSNYSQLLEAKHRCYLKDIIFPETVEEVKLPLLLIDHTVERLISVQHSVLNQAHVGGDISIP